jgi:hypothetical protein
MGHWYCVSVEICIFSYILSVSCTSQFFTALKNPAVYNYKILYIDIFHSAFKSFVIASFVHSSDLHRITSHPQCSYITLWNIYTRPYSQTHILYFHPIHSHFYISVQNQTHTFPSTPPFHYATSCSP